MAQFSLSKTLPKLWQSKRVQDGGHSGIPVSISENRTIMLKNENSKEHSQQKVLSDYRKGLKSTILDPRGAFAHRWNMLFFIAIMMSLFVDPTFFLLPEVRPELCIDFGGAIKVVLTMLRSGTDFFYMVNILFQFRMAYVAPSSRVIGIGELVTDPSRIARRYLRFSFWIDLTAALPLPQIFIWVFLPHLKGFMTSRFRIYLMFVITVQTLQLLHRFFLAYPLSLQLCKASGVVTEKAWVGAAYTLVFYLFASIVSGNLWYILSIQRQRQCWDMVCDQESVTCEDKFFDCSALGIASRNIWFETSNITRFCDPDNNLYSYGIYSFVVTDNLSTGGFLNKFFYCLWWGIRNLSSQGQNLATSIDISENIFSYLVGFVGLILFGFIIANMQKYINSANVRSEEWRLKQNDLKQWMHHRKLPKELRQGIVEYYNYKWIATRGVDEGSILNALPVNLRKQTKDYLCHNLVRQVPLFNQLDDRTLHAICERLEPMLYTQGMYLFSEDEPVHEMLFIMRGHLLSYTTDGGRSGFFNSSKLGPNDFCGEELLSWILDRRKRDVLPTSTRTVKALSDVEGFTLKAEALQFITAHFKRMHSRELRDKLRYYSQQWRTWAACFVQAAWRKYRRRNNRQNDVGHDEEQEQEAEPEQRGHCLSLLFIGSSYEDMNVFVPRPDAGIEVYAARLLADKRFSSNRFG